MGHIELDTEEAGVLLLCLHQRLDMLGAQHSRAGIVERLISKVMDARGSKCPGGRCISCTNNMSPDEERNLIRGLEGDIDDRK